jgi:AcrR family transcriptional regulator
VRNEYSFRVKRSRANDPETRTASSDKREAILDAALDLFAERGFHGTAVPLIAGQAKVGAGTLYRYFESKEAIVNALYQREKRALAATLLDGFPAEAPVRAQFHELFGRLARFATTRPTAFAFLELHHHADYLDDDSRAADALVLGTTHGFVQRAQAARALRDAPAEVLMAIVYGAVVGLGRAAQAGHLDLERSLGPAEECLWDAIRGASSAPAAKAKATSVIHRVKRRRGDNP